MSDREGVKKLVSSLSASYAFPISKQAKCVLSISNF